MSERAATVIAPGDVFGKLTVEHIDHFSHLGRHWFCRCNCGGRAIRTSAALNRSVDSKLGAMCASCMASARDAIFARRDVEKRLMFLERWTKYGSLYSSYEEQVYTDELRANVSENLGGWNQSLAIIPLEAEPTDVDESDRAPLQEYEMTQKDIGELIGEKTSNVSRIEREALAKLRLRFHRVGVTTYDELSNLRRWPR